MRRDIKRTLIGGTTFLVLFVMFMIATDSTPEEIAITNAENLKAALETEIQFSCMAEVNSKAKYRHEVEYDYGSVKYREIHNNIGDFVVVVGLVKMMNSHGAMITHEYGCSYKIENGRMIPGATAIVLDEA